MKEINQVGLILKNELLLDTLKSKALHMKAVTALNSHGVCLNWILEKKEDFTEYANFLVKIIQTGSRHLWSLVGAHISMQTDNLAAGYPLPKQFFFPIQLPLYDYIFYPAPAPNPAVPSTVPAPWAGEWHPPCWATPVCDIITASSPLPLKRWGTGTFYQNCVKTDFLQLISKSSSRSEF